MHHHDLAAIAVTATVAATPTLATVIEDVTTAPPGMCPPLKFAQPGGCSTGPDLHSSTPWGASSRPATALRCGPHARTFLRRLVLPTRSS
jgi:hypothetical protein